MDDEIVNYIIKKINDGVFDDRLQKEIWEIFKILTEKPEDQAPTHEQKLRLFDAALKRMKEKGYFI